MATDKEAKMKKLFAIVLAGAISLSLAACGGGSQQSASSSASNSTPAASSAPAASSSAQKAEGGYDSLEPVELIMADSAAKGAAGQLFDELVAQKVEEITGGQMTVDLHTNGDLGNDVDLLRQMQSGDIDIVGCQVAPIVSFIPEMAIFDLPMVFATSDGDKIDAVLNGDSQTHAALSAAYENAGWHLLGFLQNATFRLTTSSTNLETLADFKGLQIRTMENSNHMAFWSAIGAQPTPLAWGEVYISLQNGTITAEENAADTVAGANLDEVQDYLACTNHILYLNQLSMNKDTWDSLDPLYQAALEQAVSEAIAEMRTELLDIDSSNKTLLEERGMTIIEYDDSFFEEVLAIPAVQELYDKIDQDTNGLAKTLQGELGVNA